MDPADVAAALLAIPRGEVLVAEPIKHGLTNASWLVRSNDQAVVVRISVADDAALQIDRSSEAAILSAVAAAGIGADVLLCDPAQRLLVTRYVAGELWSRTDARDPGNIARLAAVVRELHGIALPPGAQRLDLVRALHGYWHRLDASGHAARAGDDRTRRVALERARTVQSAGSAVLCHNDLHNLNVIDAGRIYLLDWEYAAVGPPLFDLASVCSYHAFDAERRGMLLRHYGTATDDARRLLSDACALFDYIKDLWTLTRRYAGNAKR
jgi:thiamine kinase